MRTKIVVVLLLTAVNCWAQDTQQSVNRPRVSVDYYQPRPDPAAAARAEAADLADKQKYFIPRDPWREIRVQTKFTTFGDTTSAVLTNYAKGPMWVHFSGKVTQVQTNLIQIDGWYGAPLDYKKGHHGLFVVRDFPYATKVGTELKSIGNFCAYRMTDYLSYGSRIVTPAVIK